MASFIEMSGMELRQETKERHGGNSTLTRIPTGLRHGDISFRRPLAPLSEAFTKWVNGCLGYMESKDRKLYTYDLVIKLLDANGKPLAGWLARHAYPVKWSLDSLDSAKSDISRESITVTCAGLKRITNIR